MIYGDEDIISKRLALQRVKRHLIENEVIIDVVLYIFSVREFPPDFSIALPESFEIMKPEHADNKCPYFDRPKIILTNEDSTVNITFNISDSVSSSLNERLTEYTSIVKKLHPSNVFMSQGADKNPEEVEIACYDYFSPAIDANIYNLSFFTDLQNGELFGWFTCHADSRNKREVLVRQMIQTIKPLESNS